ncbi:MAG: membrane protein insertion efficiency factor YidD [Candidatus Eremiobacteraeota bacterium]|nr:membrane protein insertion efficiency factor YidD [Candidatus Eremiobacteraeota bacterium]MCW5868623.1 membrane protein insertion efficiency factor YidD [Candidatus Eremiobacteraeota bacterium]
MSGQRVGPAQQIRNFVASFRPEVTGQPVAPETLVDTARPKDWTVLAYLEGRDRLSNSVEVALNGMEEIGSTDSVNLVAQATLVPELGDRRFQRMGEVNTRRYYLTQDDHPGKVHSPVLQQFDRQERLTSQSLEDFLCWGIEKFPAKNFAVVIKKHGLGFAANGSSVPLSARELRQTLENVEKRSGVKPAVLCWDACNMQQWEVAYELKDRAAVMTGSPEAIPAVEFPYPTMLHNLVRYPRQQDARTLGQTVVQSYAAETPQTTQFAVDLQQVEKVGARVRDFVDLVFEARVPPERLYTNLLKSASFEPKESLSLAYNFRDFSGFLRLVSEDEKIVSGEVKKAARAVLEAMASAQVDRQVDPVKAHLKNLSAEVGPSAFLPWKQPSQALRESYSQLGWSKDTGWDRLLDYTLDGPGEVRSSPGQGNLGLYVYKKYVSPYLLTDCPYEVSCSEFARQSLQELGPWEGAKWAFMRVISCQDGAKGGSDEISPPCSHQHAPKVGLPELTVQAPVAWEKSDARKRVENVLFRSAAAAGKLVGGALAALAGGLTGAVLGGFWGARAGAGTLDRFNQGVAAKYGPSKAHSLQHLQSVLVAPGRKLNELSGPVVGSLAGGLAGIGLGLAGGAAFSYRFFGGFAGLAAQNLAKEALGELPVHYHTEQILRSRYQ